MEYGHNPLQGYPKTKFGVGGGSIVVNDAHHEKALGPDWSDNEPAPQEQPVLEPEDELTPAQKKKAAKDAAKSAV